MTATDRARNHATDTCHWCPNLWIIAVDTDRRTWHACWDHLDLLPPWQVAEEAA